MCGREAEGGEGVTRKGVRGSLSKAEGGGGMGAVCGHPGLCSHLGSGKKRKEVDFAEEEES